VASVAGVLAPGVASAVDAGVAVSVATCVLVAVAVAVAVAVSVRVRVGSGSDVEDAAGDFDLSGSALVGLGMVAVTPG
jgi:hypothetical protein